MPEKKVFLYVDLDGWDEWARKNPKVGASALAWYSSFIQKITLKTGANIFEHSANKYSITYDFPDIAFSALLELCEGIFGEKWPGMGALPVKIAAHYGEVNYLNKIYSGAAATRSASLFRYTSAGNVFITKPFKEAVKNIPCNIKINQIGPVKLDDNFSEEIIFSIAFYEQKTEVASFISKARGKSNFVPQKMSFVGRDRELSGLKELFKNCDKRVLCVTGAAGIGKTRLALQLASELCFDCVDGMFLVDLSHLKDLELAICAISEVLRAESIAVLNNESLLDRLVTLIHARKTILVLDGVDRIKDIGKLVRKLIKECLFIKIITTSKNTPEIGPVDVCTPEPLRIPLETEAAQVKLLPAYSGVDFILEAAISAGSRMDYSDYRFEGILEFCRKMEGNLYAMELFIANYENTGIQNILSALNSAADSLNFVIDYVFTKTLTEEEKNFLTLAAVFEPSFNIADAATLCAAAGGEFENITLLCERLCNKRILFRAVVPENTVSYRMPQQIRTYVKAGEKASFEMYSRLYEEYLTGLSERYKKEAGTINDRKVTAEVMHRKDNFRMLLLKRIEEKNAGEAMKLLLMFALLDENLNTFFEIPFWLEKILIFLDPGKYKKEIQYLEIRKGWRLTIVSNKVEFLGAILKVLREARGAGYFDIQVLALNQLGWRYLIEEDFDRAFEYFDEALSLVDKVADPLLVADVYLKQSKGWGSRGNTGKFLEFSLLVYNLLRKYELYYSIPYFNVLSQLEDYYCQVKDFDSENLYLAELKKRNEELEDKVGLASVISRFGKMEGKKNNYEKASGYYREALAYYSQAGNISGMSTVMINLADCDFRLGNYSAALTEGIEGVKLGYETYNHQNLEKALLSVALSFQKLGYNTRAVYMFGAYKGFIKKRVAVKVIFDSSQIDLEPFLKDLRLKIPRADFASAWIDGFNGEMETVVTEVLKRNHEKR